MPRRRGHRPVGRGGTARGRPYVIEPVSTGAGRRWRARRTTCRARLAGRRASRRDESSGHARTTARPLPRPQARTSRQVPDAACCSRSLARRQLGGAGQLARPDAADQVAVAEGSSCCGPWHASAACSHRAGTGKPGGARAGQRSACRGSPVDDPTSCRLGRSGAAPACRVQRDSQHGAGRPVLHHLAGADTATRVAEPETRPGRG